MLAPGRTSDGGYIEAPCTDCGDYYPEDGVNETGQCEHCEEWELDGNF